MKYDGKASNLQRVLWVFLGYTLLGPFFAGLAVTLLLILAPVFKLSALLPLNVPPLGVAALGTFVWSAIPAAISAIIVIPFLLRNGNVSWIAAAAAGVLGFGVASLATDFPYRDFTVFFALLSGLISLGVREALRGGNIID